MLAIGPLGPKYETCINTHLKSMDISFQKICDIRLKAAHTKMKRKTNNLGNLLQVTSLNLVATPLQLHFSACRSNK